MGADNITYCPYCKDRALREYVDVGIVDGILVVNYEARCYTCEFKFKYEHEEKVEVDYAR